ncbi:hypothetical protein [Polyangium jinanense]|uniref:Uncharacterized protein n=1 Tax=Polyangium jinanense TaxID=2829994 RepID=A0A9X3XE56_9BACT|nr:hypothetical protein [Polyangium jinanense]MDC3960953.1 hypothetical protein [Polyangium jinanense]MDC3987373.1 hypothetical protein [Polyangium jinanense]
MDPQKPQKPSGQTVFSHQHYHELSADETEVREQGWASIGSPAEGPSLREAELEAEPTPPPPHSPGGEHVEPVGRVHADQTEPSGRRR